MPTNLELAKKIKAEELNVDAETTIHKGQNVTLSTGTEFFSFTLNDQANITGLYSDLLVVTQGGESLMGIINKDGNILVPYHADEYICNYYSAQDWVSLVQQMGQFKLYNLTYVNIAKIYIKSQNDIDKVNAFKYGDALPKAYNDHLLYITSGGKKGKLMDE